MDFNNSQLKAIESKNNTLVSAGAGSGKTQVLTEKVYRLIDENVITPQNLLALTFTNAAAYSMKQKIIKKFKEKGSSKKDELLSCHIETFDAFSAFLVRKYSNRLNIDSSFKIINSSLISSLTKNWLKEILEELYKKEDPQIVRIVSKLFYQDDDSLTGCILNLMKELNKLVKEEREYYLNLYLDEEYNSKSLNSLYSSILQSLVFKPLKDIYLEWFGVTKVSEELGKQTKTTEFLDEIFDYIHSDLFGKNNIAELETIFSLAKGTKVTGLDDNQATGLKLLKDILNSVKENKVFENFEIEQLLEFKEDLRFILDIVKRLYQKINDYKFTHSSYEFSDISELSLSLLTDEKYKDIKNEIISKFNYILVDEYQDTNDIQEAFVNAFLEKEGNIIFLVGDKKQSIYRFRNANPSLFDKRKDEFNKPSKGTVIDMNTNYRSVKKVLDDVNTFFKVNMSLRNGGIEFTENEMLVYDDYTDLYNEGKLYKKGDYGIYVIQSFGSSPFVKGQTQDDLDITTICLDILNKIKNKYKVYDLEKKSLRDCSFGDFAILSVKNKRLKAYKKVLSSLNIPYNLSSTSDYLEEGPNLTLFSFFKLYLIIKNDWKDTDDYDVSQIFMSLGRSFIFNLTDEELFDLLRDKNKRKENIINHEIYKNVEEFVTKTKDMRLSDIFLKFVEEFDFLNRLILLGDIIDKQTTIEYFFGLCQDIEKEGGEVEEFVQTLEDLKENDEDIESDIIVQNKNSVELATIHKSKGLEYKIVYLPFKACEFSKKKYYSIFDFNKEVGLFVSTKQLDHVKTYLAQDFIKRYNEIEDKNEFERVLYVALTRAKETIYLVNPISRSRNSASLTSGLEEEFFKAFPLNIRLSDDFVSFLMNHFTLDDEIDRIKELINIINSAFDISKLSSAQKELEDFDFEEFSNKINSLVEDKNIFRVSKSIKERDLMNDRNKTVSNLMNALSKAKGIINCLVLTHLFEKIEKEPALKEKLNGKQNYSYLLSQKRYIEEKEEYKFDYNQLRDNKVLYLLNLIEDNDIIEPLFYYSNGNCKNIYYDFRKELRALNDNEKEEVSLNLNEEEFDFRKREVRKASKGGNVSKYDQALQSSLEYGTHLHYLLEMTDFKTKDTSFIKNEKDKRLIDNVLALPIFNNVTNSKIYKEYQYYLMSQEGIVDLLIVKDNEIDIIDYKTKKIDDEAYHRQLKIYKDSIDQIMNKDNKYKINTYLLSIIDHKLEEINLPNE